MLLPLVVALALVSLRIDHRSVPAAQAAPADPFRALLAHSRDLGPVAAAANTSFVALVRDQTAPRRSAEIAAMYDPSSTTFGRYQTAQQWSSAHDAAAHDARRAAAFLKPFGIAVRWQPGTDSVLIGGPAASIERVFRVRIHAYMTPSGGRYAASTRDPIVPPQLSAELAGTGHISSYPDRRARILPVSGLRPGDLLTAYNIKPLRSHGLTGAGETIVFIEIDAFSQDDLNLFTKHFGLPAMRPNIANGVTLSKIEGEADLDLEVAHEIAPRARLLVYNCSNCTDTAMVQLESQVVRANPRSIISISLGACETAEGSQTVKAEANIFAEADALGETVLVASGDNGAYTCLEQAWGATPSPQYVSVSSPSSAPGVTAVGGTSLSLTANSSWYREEAWQNAPASSGTGGGISAYFARPSWQYGPGVVNAYDSSGRREVPDVSADGDPLTGAQVVIQGQLAEVGGTSQATPIWAAIIADINQYLQQHNRQVVGFMNPALYALAAGSPPYPPFHDITVGDNLLYPATPGYDLATGLGTPNAWNLARDLTVYEGKR
jgi:kumamolisin